MRIILGNVPAHRTEENMTTFYDGVIDRRIMDGPPSFALVI